MYGVSPEDTTFDNVVNALLTNIDNSIAAFNSSTLLAANAENLGKVLLNGKLLTSASIDIIMSRLEPRGRAFVIAGDANKNIFLREFFHYQNDYRGAQTLIHEVSHFHPNGVAGGGTSQQ